MKPLQTCLLAASAIPAPTATHLSTGLSLHPGTVTAEIINDGDLSWRVSHDGKEVFRNPPYQ